MSFDDLSVNVRIWDDGDWSLDVMEGGRPLICGARLGRSIGCQYDGEHEKDAARYCEDVYKSVRALLDAMEVWEGTKC